MRHFYCGKAGIFLMLNELLICLFWASLVAKSVKNLPAMQGTQILSMDWEDPLEKGMATHSYSCLENSMDKGAWSATVHGVAKSWT